MTRDPTSGTKVRIDELEPGDRFDDGYPNGLVTVRAAYPSNERGTWEVEYGIRDDDVQGTLYYLASDIVRLVNR